MSIEHIRLSNQARDQLVKLKRHTGIQNWNVLCRWAFCISLADPTVPATVSIPADSSIEMIWRVFGGSYSDIYLALLKQRCHNDGLGVSDETISSQFRLHLHRGIGRLAGDQRINQIEELIKTLI